MKNTTKKQTMDREYLLEQFSGDDSDQESDQENESIIDNLKYYRFDEDVPICNCESWSFPIIRTYEGIIQIIFDNSFKITDCGVKIDFGGNLSKVRQYYISKMGNSINNQITISKPTCKNIKSTKSEVFLNEIAFPFYFQINKDGISCVANRKGIFYNNKVYTCPFFNEIEMFLRYLPHGSSLDCTIYNENLKCSEALKIFKKKFYVKGNISEHTDNFKCYVNDLIIIDEDMILTKRSKVLHNAYELFKTFSFKEPKIEIATLLQDFDNSEIKKFNSVIIKNEGVYSLNEKDIILHN